MKKRTDLNLLFILLSVCYGGATEQLPQDIFAAEGSQVMFPMQEKLQINQIQEGECDEFTWQVIPIHKTMRTTIMSANHNCNPYMFYGNFSSVSQVSHNGSLLLYNITGKNAGKYIVTVKKLNWKPWFEKIFILHVQVAISDPVLGLSCESEERAMLTCRVQNGTDPFYTWHSDGAVMGNTSSLWEVNGNNLTVPLPFLGNINCIVRNNVTEKRVSLSGLHCPGPNVELPNHLYIKGAIFLLNTALIYFMVSKWREEQREELEATKLERSRYRGVTSEGSTAN